MDISEKQQREIEFYRESPIENPYQFTIDNLINKMSSAKSLLENLVRYKQLFENKQAILELGGGQGWASCIVQSYFPNALHVINSDISKYALQSTCMWNSLFNSIFKVNINKLVCKAYEIPLKEASVDLVFTFEAAHHFLKHKSTLKEIYRILAKGGCCLYLHEFSCNKFFYPFAYKRSNKKRSIDKVIDKVSEDVLIYRNILKLAKDVGFTALANYDPSIVNRSPEATVYYFILNKISFLKHILPCTRDYIFIKP